MKNVCKIRNIWLLESKPGVIQVGLSITLLPVANGEAKQAVSKSVNFAIGESRLQTRTLRLFMSLWIFLASGKVKCAKCSRYIFQKLVLDFWNESFGLWRGQKVSQVSLFCVFHDQRVRRVDYILQMDYERTIPQKGENGDFPPPIFDESVRLFERAGVIRKVIFLHKQLL
jgi:hypothetical protein